MNRILHSRRLPAFVIAALIAFVAIGTGIADNRINGIPATDPLAVFQKGNSFANIATNTTTLVQSGAGTLHTVTINTAGTGISVTTIYNSLTASGAKIATINTAAVTGTLTLDVATTIGITIVTTGTASPDITVSYR